MVIAEPDTASCEGTGALVLPVEGPWRLRFVDQVTAGRPVEGFCAEAGTETVPADGLGSWTDWPEMAYFTGRIAYETEITLPDGYGGGRVLLDLGRVGELAWVSVNGQPQGVRMWAPYRFDITSGVHAGANTLRVEVANTMAVHLEHARIASGLLGPVTVRIG